ncbi:MAG: metalloregulator ArsR/SmtB family transcription factor [Alphaproteobacteria bacterium]|nr:metalloregulator ArsR/SmtB family transcription factor [Alphaproteobacteria bacterium]
MEQLLGGLRAAAEPTRMRLLKVCAQQELTVSELTRILGQSQPRISRHLKLLCDAGLMERVSEGAWAYFHLVGSGPAADLARQIIDLIPERDTTVARDMERLAAVMDERAGAAAAFFRQNAAAWDKIRSLHIEEPKLEGAVARLFPAGDVGDFLDIGTGTGRMLVLLGDRARTGIGLDASREMLAVARVNLANAERHNCTVRQGDMYDLPWSAPSFDAATLHMVLHYAGNPQAVVKEAARVLRPGGTLLIADFAPHAVEMLRTEEAHQRMGFATAEIRRWMKEAGLTPAAAEELPGDPLTVMIWTGVKERSR